MNLESLSDAELLKLEETTNNLATTYNNLQLAKKVTLNSAYGALGNRFYRWFDVRLASAITGAGELAIKWIIKDMNKFMNDYVGTKDEDYIIAADTDSMYIHLEKVLKKDLQDITDKNVLLDHMNKFCDETIQPVINKSFENLSKYMNSFEQKMVMKREVLADRGIWTAKKNYVLNVMDDEGVRLNEPKIKIKGLAVIKSSTAPACKDSIKEAIRLMMTADNDAMIRFIKKFKKEYDQRPYDELADISSVNGLEKYHDNRTIWGKKCPKHTKGALIYNHLLKKHGLENTYEAIKDGEKIKYIHLKEPNPYGFEIISFHDRIPEEFGLEEYVDYTLQFHKTFLKKLKIITDAIGWQHEKSSDIKSLLE